MSQSKSIELNCPHCEARQPFVLYGRVDAAKDPALKAGLLSGELMRLDCTDCGRSSMIAHDMLYHDAEDKLLVWLTEGEEAADIDRPLPPRLLDVDNEDYLLRIVTSYNALCEKIRLAAEGLSDVRVELFKLLWLLYRKRPVNQPMFFDHRDEAEGSLVFVVLEEGQPEGFAVAQEEFERVLGPVAQTLTSPDASGPWKRVDRQMAIRLMRQAREILGLDPDLP